jgi:hypothetical protein
VRLLLVGLVAVQLGRKGVYVFICRAEFEFEFGFGLERRVMACLFGEKAYSWDYVV